MRLTLTSQTLAPLKAHLLSTPRPFRVLFVGDVIGKPGRRILKKVLPELKSTLEIDFSIVNGENLAGGFGLTKKTFEEITAAGADVVTLGNHWSDKPDVHNLLDHDPRLVCPLNIERNSAPTRLPVFNVPGQNFQVGILNLMGNFAMKDTYRPLFEFPLKEKEIWAQKVDAGVLCLLGDIHAESSAEKQAIAWYLDGIMSAMVGTHTHTPTADERILPKGTAIVSDVGMTGAYDSVIGMTVEGSLRRYLPNSPRKPQEVAEGNVWLCAFLVEIDVQTRKTLQAHRIEHRENDGSWTISTVSKH